MRRPLGRKFCVCRAESAPRSVLEGRESDSSFSTRVARTSEMALSHLSPTIQSSRNAPLSQREDLVRSFENEGYVTFEGMIDETRLEVLRESLVREYHHVRESTGLFAGGGTV